jgi:hypothetical protein
MGVRAAVVADLASVAVSSSVHLDSHVARTFFVTTQGSVTIRVRGDVHIADDVIVDGELALVAEPRTDGSGGAIVVGDSKHCTRRVGPGNAVLRAAAAAFEHSTLCSCW